jgi:hypothetical protein
VILGVRRRLVFGLFGILLASGLAAAPPAAREARAATPDLTLIGDARYDVQPQNRRVRVTVDLVATNHLEDTAARRFYFDRAFLQVQPGTTGFRLTSPTGSASVRATKRTADSTILQLTFGQQIFSGKSASFQLRFDVPDPGGRPARDVRVGRSVVSFPAWGFGSPSTPGGSVAVAFPAGYTIQVFGGQFPAPSTGSGGTVTYASGRLSDPARFSAFFLADRPASYVETTAVTKVRGTDASLTIRSWSDDAAWGKRVKALFERGLPVIADAVGLPWTRAGSPLIVQESVSRTTGGYAGLFDPSAGLIEVAYYADSFVILHEASHSWFNGALLADRWANEAFASYYALVAAGKLDEKADAKPLTAELRKARIPLNAWGAVGAETGTSEDYAYAASLTLATEIGKRAGADGLRRVWAAAAAHQGAYQPAGADAAAGAVERVDAAPDWRGLLDLLEDTTGKRFDDLWRQWVVRDAEAPLLATRATARTAYAALVADAGTWRLPGTIRAALRGWQFDQATGLMTAAKAVLARRNQLETAARAVGLQLPNRLETAFESSDGVAAANDEFDAELATIQAIVAAGEARLTRPGPLEQLGLLAVSPDEQLASARQAFAKGDLLGAAQAAASAQSSWARAGDAGLNRALAAVATVLLILLGLVVLASSRRDRRRRAILERRGADL